MRRVVSKRSSGFMYVATLSVVTVLLILVYALDYQSRSSRAVSRSAESRLYTDLAVANHVGETLASVRHQSRTNTDWLDPDIPISVDSSQNANRAEWDRVKAIESWTAENFPTIGSFPYHSETSKSLGQEVTSPVSEDDGELAAPGQTRATLVPESNDVGFRAPRSKYRMSLIKAFPFAAYAPEGKVNIQGAGVSWANPSEPELDTDHRTLDFYTGFPFRIGAKGEIQIEELAYGEAYSLEEAPLVKGGGIGFRGHLPYRGEEDGYAVKLKESLVGSGSFVGGLALTLNANSYDKTDLVFGTLNVGNIIEAIFSPSTASFNNFLTYEQSTRWWFILIPGFKSRGPALDITLHSPLKPDFGTYDSSDEVFTDDQDIAMTEELQEATDELERIEQKLGSLLLSPKLSDDRPKTQPLSTAEVGGEQSPDFVAFTEIINSRNTAEQKYEQAEEERDKITGDEEDKAADARHKANAERLEKEAGASLSKYGFGSVDDIDDWADRSRKGSYTDEDGDKKSFTDDYEDILGDWEDAQKEFAEAKDDSSGLNEGKPAADEYDPGPTREREKELVKDKELSKNGWKGTNLWTMVEKIAIVIANLVKDVGEAFYNHVFVEVKIFGATIPLPNPVKVVTFFFADGEFKTQDIQGQAYAFQKDGVPDLLELVLVTLKRALVQEVTLVYLGKDGGIGPSVPIRIGPDSAVGYQKGEPEAEVPSFSIHNSFTVPAGRTFKLLPKDGVEGMTIAADLWLQRGSTMYIQGDLTMVNPVEELTQPHKPKGKIVMDPGSTLVVDGNLIGAGDPFMGSVLLTRRAGRVEVITSGIICTGSVELPHGIRNGFNLIQLAELVDVDVSKVMTDFFDDVVPNVAKIMGPFHSRKPFFAANGATFTFYFPVIVPNPVSSLVSKNINVKLFGLLSPLFAGSMNMTLGENFVTSTDWWMFGEDRLPVLPKVLPGAIEATLGEAAEQGESLFDSGRASLDKMIDEKFFLDRTRGIVEGELGVMFDKVEGLAENMDDFIGKVAEDTLVKYFTIENVTTKVVEFLGKAAASALDPTGIALLAFEKISEEVLPPSGDSFVTEMTTAAKDELETNYGFPTDGKDYLQDLAVTVLEPFTDMATELKDQAEQKTLRVATTLLAAETPGVLIYGDSLTVGGLYAAGMFVANYDIEMNCAYTIGSLLSVQGDITAREVLYVPEFTRANLYEPPEVVETPKGRGIERLPSYWANSLGLDFGEGGFAKALDYGNGTGDGVWHQIPDLNHDTAFRVSGGWGQ